MLHFQRFFLEVGARMEGADGIRSDRGLSGAKIQLPAACCHLKKKYNAHHR